MLPRFKTLSLEDKFSKNNLNMHQFKQTEYQDIWINENAVVFNSYMGRCLSIHCDSQGYPLVQIPKQKTGRKYFYARISRLLMKTFCPIENMESFMVDHIDGNKLNHSLCNLRWCDNRVNQQNTRKHREGKLVGATFNLKEQKWRSEIRINKRLYTLGRFNTESEAHEAYLEACKNLDRIRIPEN